MNVQRPTTRLSTVGACRRVSPACASGQSILLAGNDGTTTTVAAVTTGAVPRRLGRRRRSACSRRARPRRRRPTPSRRRAPRPRHRRQVPSAGSPPPRASRWRSPATPTSHRARSTPSTRRPNPSACSSGTRCSRPRAMPWPTSPTSTTPARTASSSSCRTRTATRSSSTSTSSRVPEDRPEVVQMPEYMLQQMADDNSVVTASACIQAAGTDMAPFLPRALLAYQTGGVQWAMPLNISVPVLFYNRVMFEEAGLDPDVAADHARPGARVLAADRRLRRGAVRHRPRRRRQLRRCLVPRAVAGQRRAAVRRQRQRAHGAGDAGALRHARDRGDADVRAGPRRPTTSPSTSARTRKGSTGC